MKKIKHITLLYLNHLEISVTLCIDQLCIYKEAVTLKRYDKIKFTYKKSSIISSMHKKNTRFKTLLN